MVKLIIDDNEVVMDSDFNTDVIRENPLITSAGDYSYDIDVDLRVPQNRRIYKDFQRLNTLSSFSQRKAELLDNEKVLARGTEAVLSIEGTRAKIQVLSNNSELNYIFDETRSVRELDFGSVQTKTTELAAKVSTHLYGDVVDGVEVREAYPMVSREDFGGYGSHASFFNTPAGFPGSYAMGFDNVDNLRPMPYLLYYIDKIVEVLGYTMGECHIDRDKYKRLLVIHGYDTLEYAKMLPDWTVSQFISEVEKFFGVVFLVDSIHKKIDIVSVDKFYETAGCEYIEREDVIDEHDVSFDVESESFQTSFQNIGYKLPNSEYWQLAAVDEEVDRRCVRKTKIFGVTEEYDPKEMVIFYDHHQDVEWIHYEEATESQNSKYARFVNFFAPVVKDDAVDRTLLSITPVKMACSYRVDDTVGGFMFAVPIPEYYENKTPTLSGAIREGTSENAGDRMQVAFYLGFCHYRDISGARSVFSYGTTQCTTSRYLQLYNVDWSFTTQDTEDINRNLTLELRGKKGRCANELNGDELIDGKRQFKIRFVTREFLDPRKKFVIANRLFYCRQLRYKMENGVMNEIVEGLFYPSKSIQLQEVETPNELDTYLEALQGEEVWTRVYAYSSSEPFDSGGRMMWRFDSRDNGYENNQLSVSRYADESQYPVYHVIAELMAAYNSFYQLSEAKVAKFINGRLVDVIEDAQLNVRSGSFELPSGVNVLCDSSPLEGLEVGNELAYVVEGTKLGNSEKIFGCVKINVVD